MAFVTLNVSHNMKYSVVLGLHVIFLAVVVVAATAATFDCNTPAVTILYLPLILRSSTVKVVVAINDISSLEVCMF